MKNLRKNSELHIVDAYFRWLCGTVGIGEQFGNRKETFAKSLHAKSFRAIIANDDNRAVDGQKLREQFADATLDEDCRCLDGECTMLEMLVALALRMAFIVPTNRMPKALVPSLFARMVANLGLERFEDDDPHIDRKINRNNEAMEKWLNRQYTSMGVGGLFPLKVAREDQRRTEIWYQMMAYIDENFTY